MASLLIVEDEPHIASGLRFNLEVEGHDVHVAETGEAALEVVASHPDDIDLVVLDVMLPGMDGFDVATSLRARGWFRPVLMLTARGRAEDVLRGFEAGADDYLPKPFDLAILVARVQALLRRHAWHASPPPAVAESAAAADDAEEAPGPFVFRDKVFDYTGQCLRVGEVEHPLTLMETNLLQYLVQHEGRIVSRKRMLEDVWNLHEDTDTRAIDHFVARLRKYVEDEPASPRHLLTVRGVGYRFIADP